MNSPKRWLSPGSLQDALDHGLTEKEFKNVQELLGRPLKLLEVGVFGSLFSEKRSLKTSRSHLKALAFEGATGLQGAGLQGVGDEAGTIEMDDGRALAIKIERIVEPPTGADGPDRSASSLLGALRDVAATGARPVAFMTALRAGDPADSRAAEALGRLNGAAAEIERTLGIPELLRDLFFHETYSALPIATVVALGIVEKEKVLSGRPRTPGDLLVAVGAPPGAGGESGGNDQRPLSAAIEAIASGAVAGAEQIGARSLAAAAFRIASRGGGKGVRLELDRWGPLGENAPYDLMVGAASGDSSLDFLLVAEKGKEEDLLRLLEANGSRGRVVGEVIARPEVEIVWEREVVSSIPVALAGAVSPHRQPAEPPPDYDSKLRYDVRLLGEPTDLREPWLKLLRAPNLHFREAALGSKLPGTSLRERSDACAVNLPPMKRKPKGGPDRVVVVALSSDPRHSGLDPRQGASLAFADAYRQLRATGALPLCGAVSGAFGNVERPAGMWQLAEAVRGLGDAARAFEIPVASVAMSLGNEMKGKSIFPTADVALFGLAEDPSKLVGGTFREEGDVVFVLGAARDGDLGGSEYLAHSAGVEKGRPPVLNYDLEVKTAETLRALIEKRLLFSCRAASRGGLALALARCCFGPERTLGVTLDLEKHEGRRDALLFAESGARYVISCDLEASYETRAAIEAAGLVVSLAGTTGGKVLAIRNFAEVPLTEAEEAWRRGGGA